MLTPRVRPSVGLLTESSVPMHSCPGYTRLTQVEGGSCSVSLPCVLNGRDMQLRRLEIATWPRRSFLPRFSYAGVT